MLLEKRRELTPERTVDYKLALTKGIAKEWTIKAFAICLYGDWTPCCYSCWSSTTLEGVHGGMRHSVLQGIWWDRSLDSWMFLGTDFMISLHLPGFSSWIGTIPWRRKWQSTPVLLPGESHGQRSLVGYSPWGLNKSDMTERLHFHFYLLISREALNPFMVTSDPHD